MNDIQITEDKTYTLSEVIDFVKQTLDRVSEKSTRDPLRYSSTDVYWLLHDMLRYVNRNIPGEFTLLQTQKGIYRVTYADEGAAKQKSDRNLKTEVNRTARYLEELTGRKPSWGEKE
ncbi:hypothetical protein J4G07_13125 [Candidatus Poribacteria bacterium]|nr:hypothetical protein [Candidatus Poribacteria bacterium]